MVSAHITFCAAFYGRDDRRIRRVVIVPQNQRSPNLLNALLIKRHILSRYQLCVKEGTDLLAGAYAGHTLWGGSRGTQTLNRSEP